MGTAQRALDESVSYAATAAQGGSIIGDFQLVQTVVATQQTGALAGRALVRIFSKKRRPNDNRSAEALPNRHTLRISWFRRIHRYPPTLPLVELANSRKNSN